MFNIDWQGLKLWDNFPCLRIAEVAVWTRLHGSSSQWQSPTLLITPLLHCSYIFTSKKRDLNSSWSLSPLQCSYCAVLSFWLIFTVISINLFKNNLFNKIINNIIKILIIFYFLYGSRFKNAHYQIDQLQLLKCVLYWRTCFYCFPQCNMLGFLSPVWLIHWLSCQILKHLFTKFD